MHLNLFLLKFKFIQLICDLFFNNIILFSLNTFATGIFFSCQKFNASVNSVKCQTTYRPKFKFLKKRKLKKIFWSTSILSTLLPYLHKLFILKQLFNLKKNQFFSGVSRISRLKYINNDTTIWYSKHLFQFCFTYNALFNFEKYLLLYGPH